MANKKVFETNVLIATAKWLKSNGWDIINVSIINAEKKQLKPKLVTEFIRSGIPINTQMFKSSGPDIIAQRNTLKWKIECKGLTSGEPGTKRENFSRALASTVSYFEGLKDDRIGIAMPDYYRSLVSIKISDALRQVLNLWVFFYNHEKYTIEVFEPSKKFNFERQTSKNIQTKRIPSDKPQKMKLLGEEYVLNHAYEILINTANWLIKNKKLTSSDCPVSVSGGKRYLINKEAKHRYGGDFTVPRKLSNGLWIETHAGIPIIITYAERLLHKFGVSPNEL